jgi:hypothetical protein
MRIAPRTPLCAHEYRIRSGRADVEFAELKELCAVAGDKRSLAIGLAGLSLATQLGGVTREASGLATELVRLLDSVGDPALTVALSVAFLNIPPRPASDRRGGWPGWVGSLRLAAGRKAVLACPRTVAASPRGWVLVRTCSSDQAGGHGCGGDG